MPKIRDYPLSSEIDIFNDALSDKNTNEILKQIDIHSIPYFFNLKLNDKYGLTLFHYIILLDLTEMFHKITEKFIYKFREESDFLKQKKLKEKDENDYTLINLLSKTDKEGNTPMLYAAFRGNIDIIKILIDLGVSYEKKNFAGLDIIHMASQNNQENVIVYFKEKYNYDIFKSDKEGNTSIHWASAIGGKNALDYLLYYINDKNFDVINKLNDKGQNALQLTIITAQNISACKKLIKKGINFNNKDKNNLTVFDIVKNDKKLKNIENVLYTYTHKNCFGLNYHINDKLNKYFKLFSFIFLALLIFYMVFFEFFPFLENFKVNIKFLRLFFYINFVLMMCFYLYMMFSDPGTLKEKINVSLLKLVNQKVDLKKICPYCMVNKLPSTKHCFVCNVCIEYFDHHCHWINNCVGDGNKIQFIIFLLILLSNLFVDNLIALKVFLLKVEKEENIGFFMSDFYYRKISSLIIMIVILIFFWPVCYILYVQTKQKKKKNSQEDDERKEVQDYYKELNRIKAEDNALNHLQIKGD